MPTIDLSKEEARRAAMACRVAAVQEEQAAEKQTNPEVKAGIERDIRAYVALAAKFDRAGR